MAIQDDPGVPPNTVSGSGPDNRIMLWSASLLLMLWLFLRRIVSDDLSVLYFDRQDLPVLGALFLVLILGAAAPVRRGDPSAFLARIAPSPRQWVALLALLAVLLWWGTYGLLFDYPLTRDEHMVIFDMAVFDKGHLAEPLAPQWRSRVEALVPSFLLQPVDPIGVVSNYLPGNAWARLAFSRLADPALFNPLLAALGGVALLDIARRLFDEDRVAIFIVMLLYATSAQMLVNAMTVYAMTGHLALNLIWLAAFLRGGKMGHGVALAVGAYAMGLHQIIFHPLFVTPFLLWSMARRDWRVVLFYGVGYALAGLAWTSYPALASIQAAAPNIAGANADFLHDRLLPLLVQRNPNTALLMGFNLARFFAWQNLALLPLFFAAIPLALRNRGLAAPLMAGPILAVLAIGFLLPHQGHGWGYRYLHGFIGSFALLGGYAWQTLRDRVGARTILALMLLTPVTSLPWLLYRTHEFVQPYAALDRFISAAPTDMVLIDTQAPRAAVDQVRNLPDLSNRPLRLASHALKAADLVALCRTGSISLATRRDMHAVGFSLGVPERSPKFEALVASIADRPCFRPSRHN